MFQSHRAQLLKPPTVVAFQYGRLSGEVSGKHLSVGTANSTMSRVWAVGVNRRSVLAPPYVLACPFGFVDNMWCVVYPLLYRVHRLQQ